MTKPWVDGPFALIPSPTASREISEETLKVASEMCFVHNIIFRNLNAVLLQYEQVSRPEDAADFMIFCQCIHEAIHTHHHHEEEYFFPKIEAYTEQQGLMETNVAQHQAFEEGLKKFGEYVYSVKPEEYDPKALKEILDSFTPALFRHLNDEIPTLLALEKYGGDKLLKTYRDVEKKILSGAMDPYRVMPIALGGFDKTFDKQQVAPFPWFVPYLSWLWFSRKHKGAWRFSPCTIWSTPRKLQFAKEIN